jgi:putative alpha-1,2-mannosidase
LSLEKCHGHFPNTVVLTEDTSLESKQARALTELVIADAFYRDLIPPAQTKELLAAAKRDLASAANEDFFQNGNCEYATHVIDLSEACGAMADVARKIGEAETAKELETYASYWEKSYAKDGLLREDSPYYEGTRHNYSFRLLRPMQKRVALCGEEAYLAHLDRFFGFTHAEDTTARFEGFNNETDMETPYAYCAVGAYDRLCEIMEAQHRFCFAPGRKGAPGNVDSGAMSSCYVWNTLGIFPVAGQDCFLLGRPAVPKAVLHLPKGDLTVQCHGTGKYVREVRFQGVPLDKREVSVCALMQGGTLEFDFSDQ